ncbi:host protease inhibitor [Escherichia phage APTC-EC-2A]|uniref:Pin protease inhibitor n=1 Tax=Escherichia phage EC.W15-3 TaxID=3236634 RepID=A0AB39CB30_9CAUD|nr:peptidase [Shigella flexneri]UEP18350.1 host protease inhibitor [Escherichia phage APTC-EC-2A]WPK36404.1 protease inhibitor [Escherichia phage AV119]WPK36680.1 protease inhibitor [Escherichia phage AV120]HAL7726219.1 peptidase [Escherichia coli]
MITVDKWFRINRADTGLCNYWPELSAGTVFKVRELAKECEDDIEPDTGIIEIELSDGKIINIYDKPITYWCLWNTESVENGEIEEVVERTSQDVQKPKAAFQGERISYALAKVALKKDIDDYEGNLMQAAAEYIEWLETQNSFSDQMIRQYKRLHQMFYNT